MSPANQYKKVESEIVLRISRVFGKIGDYFAGLFKRFMALGRQRFTVMLIPHSEKKVFNFRISVFSMFFLSVVLAGVITVFFLSSTQFSGISRLLLKTSSDLDHSQASLDVIRDEIVELRRVSRNFEKSLYQALGSFGLDMESRGSSSISGGDLISFIEIEGQDSGMLRELGELRNLKELLEVSGRSLEMIGDLISAQGDLLMDLPTMWPVENGIGRITNYFGPELHPFTKQWYLHRGVDIAFRQGVPIVAAANGKVIERKYDAMGFGNYIVIRHAYGFATMYAHMDGVYVEEGDVIVQGQRIGTMGNTGLSTGPHLHFEVRIGSQVVDPERFLNIQSGR